MVGADKAVLKRVQQVHRSRPGKAAVQMGNNAVMRGASRGIWKTARLSCLENVSFVFTCENLAGSRDMGVAREVLAAVCAGAIPPLRSLCQIRTLIQGLGELLPQAFGHHH